MTGQRKRLVERLGILLPCLFPKNDMDRNLQKNKSRLGCRPDYQGPRPLSGNQDRDEKLDTGRNVLCRATRVESKNWILEDTEAEDCNRRLNLRRGLKVGTWNVRGLKKMGKLQLLGKELMRLSVDICGFAETKCTELGEISTADGHLVIFSGKEGRPHHGVGMWIHKKHRSAFAEFEPVNERIMVVKMSSKPVDLIIVQCYAPTSTSDAAEIESFYDTLEITLQRWRRKGMLLVVGDFNAKVGQGEERNITGKYGLGERNEAGQQLFDFCCSNELVIMNTKFNVQKRRRYTWVSPDGFTRNQIDYILVDHNWAGSVRKCKTYPGADGDTDHQLLVGRLKIRLCSNKTSKSMTLDLDELVGEKEVEYMCKVSNRFACLDNENREYRGTEGLWKELKSAMWEEAKDIIGVKKKRKSNDYITPETAKLAAKKRLAKNVDPVKYKELRRQVQQAVRADKEKEVVTMCEELEQHSKSGNTRKLFQIVKKFTHSFAPKLNVIRTSDGQLLTNKIDIAGRWKEYCEEMYDDSEATKKIPVMEKEPPPTKSEITKAMRRVADRKSPGPDGVPAELFKRGGECIIDKMHQLCTSIWETGEWPEEWTQTTFITLPKKGDLTKCTNYRTIALVSHASKIMLKVILERIQVKTESEIAEEQAGFRPGRGTRDQITNLHITMCKAREYNQALYMCFVDFAKAFDSVSHEKLWWTMLDMGYPAHLVSLLAQLYKKQKAQVKIANTVSEWFRVKKGVRQGCVLSPYLFNIVAEMAMRKTLDGFKGGFRIGGRRINNLRYADDIVLIATSPDELKDLLERLVKAGAEYGLRLNADKTKVMVLNADPVCINVDGIQLEQVKEFTYLGFRITDDAKYESEIKTRLALGLAILSKFNKIWKNKNISIPTKERLLHALVWPVATYGCEAWTLRKEEEKRIDAFEMKCLRRMLGIVYLEKKTNLQVLCKAGTERKLLAMVKKRKLQYFGHVSRQGDTLEKAIMLGIVNGKRKRGRPRTSWIKNITEWTEMTIPESYRASQERSNWRKMIHIIAQRRCDGVA